MVGYWIIQDLQLGSEDKLIWYSNGLKQFVPQMVCFPSHVFNRKLIFCDLNGKKFTNQMAVGYRTSGG